MQVNVKDVGRRSVDIIGRSNLSVHFRGSLLLLKVHFCPLFVSECTHTCVEPCGTTPEIGVTSQHPRSSISASVTCRHNSSKAYFLFTNSSPIFWSFVIILFYFFNIFLNSSELFSVNKFVANFLKYILFI
jgi:hypothetical protein